MSVTVNVGKVPEGQLAKNLWATRQSLVGVRNRAVADLVRHEQKLCDHLSGNICPDDIISYDRNGRRLRGVVITCKFHESEGFEIVVVPFRQSVKHRVHFRDRPRKVDPVLYRRQDVYVRLRATKGGGDFRFPAYDVIREGGGRINSFDYLGNARRCVDENQTPT